MTYIPTEVYSDGSMKKRFSLWRLLQNRLLTHVELRRRGAFSDAQQQCCILCSNGIETARHLEFNLQLDEG